MATMFAMLKALSIFARLADAISRRSLQRRLAQFVSEGKLTTEGKGRGLYYQIRS